MGSIRKRSDTGLLFFDFRYQSKRCREQTALKDTLANRARLEKVLKNIEKEIKDGAFEYHKYFPNSKNLKDFGASEALTPSVQTSQVNNAEAVNDHPYGAIPCSP